MATEKSMFKLLLHGVITFLILFGLIGVALSSGGKFLRLELVGLCLLMLLSFLGLSFYSSWGERALFYCYLFYLINLALVWYYTGAIYLVLLILAVIGFLFSICARCSSCKKNGCNPYSVEEKVDEVPHSMVFDDKKESEVKEVVETPKVVHSPGKYVGSKRGNVYHLPKCDWGKRISEERRVWFKNKKEAQSSGYKTHSCVE
jgi:hypothetical protein